MKQIVLNGGATTPLGASRQEIDLPDGRLWVIPELTPSMAEAFLSKQHPQQRKLYHRHVGMISRAMSQGAYRWTADPIKFDRHGHLIDGQHRLHAIVASQCTVKNVIAVQIADDDVHKFLDTVTRPRSLHDVRRFLGQAKIETSVAAAIALDFCDFNLNDRQNLSVPEVNELVESFPHLSDVSELYRIGRRKVYLTAGPLAGAVHCLQVNHDAAMSFFGAAFSNTHVIDNMEEPAAKLLAEWLIRSHAQRSSRTAHGSEPIIVGAEKAIRAYNAWRRSEPLLKLQQGRTGLMPKAVG